MKRFYWIVLMATLLGLCAVPAKATERAYGFCEQGAQQLVVSGLQGTPDIQASYPACTVTVYLTGTTNLATIYSDATNTPLANPFTASSTTGYWYFYAANGRYDVQISGAGIATPFTFGDILLPDTGGSSSGLLIGTYAVLSFSSTPTFNAGVATTYQMTLSGNVTASTVSNPTLGQFLSLVLCQNGTGGYTFAWPSNFLTPPTVASSANACTNVTFVYDGTNWRAFAVSTSVAPLETSSGLTYVDGTNGSDGNNCLSWGTACKTPYAALLALPGGSTTTFTSGYGTVYITQGTIGTILGGGPLNSISIVGALDSLHFSNPIASATRSGNVVTLTFTANPHYANSRQISVYSVAGGATSFNGHFTITSAGGSTPWPITYSQTGPNESATSSTGGVIPYGYLHEGAGGVHFYGYGPGSGANFGTGPYAIISGAATPEATLSLMGVGFRWSFDFIEFVGQQAARVGCDSNYGTANAGAAGTFFHGGAFSIDFPNNLASGPPLETCGNVLSQKMDHIEFQSLGAFPVPITSIARSSNVVTATISGIGTNFPIGNGVIVLGVTDTTFNNGSTATPFIITSTSGSTTVSWNQTGSDGTSTGGYIYAVPENNNRASWLINPTGASSTTGLLYLDTCNFNGGGGIRWVSATLASSMVANDCIMEGSSNSQPLFESLVTTGPVATLSRMDLSDSGNTPPAIKCPAGTPPGQINFDQGSLGAGISIDCPSTTILGIPLSYFTNNPANVNDAPIRSPLGKSSFGQFGVRTFTQIDDVRQNNSPALSRYTNILTTPCASWTNVTGANLTITCNRPDESGGTSAANLSVSTSTGVAHIYSANRTAQTGDIMIMGCWERGSSAAGISYLYFQDTPCYLSSSTFPGTPTFAGVGYNQYGGGSALANTPSSADQGQWQWIWAWDRIQNIATNSTTSWQFDARVPTGYPDDIYEPVFYHIPLSSISRTAEAITSVARVDGVTTVTTTGTNTLSRGQIACLQGITDTTFNVCGEILLYPAATSSTFAISNANAEGNATSTGGTAYEDASSQAAEIALALTGQAGLCSVASVCDALGVLPHLNKTGTWTASQTFSAASTFNATVSINAPINLGEVAAPLGISATDVFWADSTAHWPKFNPNNAGTVTVAGITGAIIPGDCAQFTSATTIIDNGSACGSGGTGTVTSVSANAITTGTQNFVTAAVTNPGTTPALTFTLANAPTHTFFMNNTAGSAAPDYESASEADLPSATVFTDKAATFGAHAYDFSAATVTLPSVFVRTDTDTTFGAHAYDFSAATVTLPSVFVRTDANATFGAHTYNFSSATLLKPPAAAGFTATANDFGLDTTAKNWHFWANGADSIAGVFASAPTTGNCVQANVSGGNILLADSGVPCGTNAGTVTSFSAGNLSPIFTTSVATATTTPALTFTLANAAAHTFLMNNTGGSTTPSYAAPGEADLPATTVWTDQGATFGAHTYNFTSAIVNLPAAFVRTDTNATFGAHNYDFSAATILKPPAAAGFASTANDFGLNTTTSNWQYWANGANKIAGMWSAAPTNNDCVKATVSSGNVLLTDAGAACGSGSGPTIQTNSSNNSSQSTLNFTNTPGAAGINFTNPSGGIESAAIANTTGGGNAVLACTQTGGTAGDYFGLNGATTCVNITPGITPNAQTGTTYTILTGDRGKVLTFTNASAMSVALPQAGSTGFSSNFYFCFSALGGGSVTVTPATSTINGNSTLVILTGQSACINSDNTNYIARVTGYASATTGSITGTALTATCDSGAVTVVGAAAGMPVAVSSTTGADVGGAFYLRASVTASNTVTVYVCGTGTPASLAYNVRIYP